MTQPGNLKILAVSGSLRAASYNSALLCLAIESAPPELRIERYDIRAIPFYDGDVEKQGDPTAVVDWKNSISAADGILFATPEYHHSIPGVLKNALDWAGRSPKGVTNASLARKPIGIMGTGGVAGTARAQLHLRQVLAETRSYVMIEPTVVVPSARQKFDETGKLLDEAVRKQVTDFMAAFAVWVRKIRSIA
ncbi:MAG: NAD(P)H-dependent oxidoreductase [Chloroflexi bacterium]|nr:NAD(P)H-dependent oxidoreductase [Chloroflexota bacterium]